MSIAKELPVVDRDFMQDCPICGRDNRMVVKGVYKPGELYPDIGYSFCNCKCIFYTNYENIKKDSGLSSKWVPLMHLAESYFKMKKDEVLSIILPDPFFVDWQQDPYQFLHWNPRKNHIIWDMDVFCEEAEWMGFKIESAEREFEVASENPQTMKVLLRK